MSFKRRAAELVERRVVGKSLTAKAYAAPSQFLKSRVGKVTAAAAVGVGIGKGVRKAINFRENLSASIYPGSTMPVEAGRIGVRTSSQPVSMTGMKFSFRRNK